jgi:thymidylate synthase
MNNLDNQYQALLQSILQYGVDKNDRTGTGTRSIFGYTIRHKMSEGFPLLTTKHVPFKLIVTELLWFLKGDTNIKYLVDNGCNIWNGDAYKKYVNHPYFLGYDDLPPIEWFNSEMKKNTEFGKRWGELGPVYGKQWRDWNGVDQIKNLINELRTNPDSRRLMVSAWNVGELDKMTLPPCHYGFQCYVREGKYLSLMWNQRSVDTFLGLPFNIASYGLLLELIAKEVNMIPDELIGSLGDVHLYSNHIGQANEQLTNESFELPQLIINDEFWNPDEDITQQVTHIEIDDFFVKNYNHHKRIKAPLSN